MQTCTQSLFETLVNTAIGYLISLATTVVVFPLLGINVPMHTNLAVVSIFTIVSIARGFALRRFFNWFHSVRGNK
jgi:hypothetical protein